MNLTPELARLQLAGLQKQKAVVDKSIEMLTRTGIELHAAVESNFEVSTDLLATALENIVDVQVLQLSLQQEGLAANIAALERALDQSGLVLPTMIPPRGVA